MLSFARGTYRCPTQSDLRSSTRDSLRVVARRGNGDSSRRGSFVWGRRTTRLLQSYTWEIQSEFRLTSWLGGRIERRLARSRNGRERRLANVFKGWRTKIFKRRCIEGWWTRRNWGGRRWQGRRTRWCAKWARRAQREVLRAVLDRLCYEAELRTTLHWRRWLLWRHVHGLWECKRTLWRTCKTGARQRTTYLRTSRCRAIRLDRLTDCSLLNKRSVVEPRNVVSRQKNAYRLASHQQGRLTTLDWHFALVSDSHWLSFLLVFEVVHNGHVLRKITVRMTASRALALNLPFRREPRSECYARLPNLPCSYARKYLDRVFFVLPRSCPTRGFSTSS